MCYYKLIQSLNYMIQVALAYCLMLCEMSFNMGVFIATIVGLTVITLSKLNSTKFNLSFFYLNYHAIF